MANSITQYAIDFIYAKISGGKVRFGNLARYVTRYQPLDFADDDLVTKYYVDSSFSPGLLSLEIPIPNTSAYPLNVNVSNFPEFVNFLDGFKVFKQVMIDDSVDYRNITINDVVIHENFTNPSKTTYASLDIYGHTIDGSTTVDNLIVTLYK